LIWDASLAETPRGATEKIAPQYPLQNMWSLGPLFLMTSGVLSDVWGYSNQVFENF
jgi:hypothetical protein